MYGGIISSPTHIATFSSVSEVEMTCSPYFSKASRMIPMTLGSTGKWSGKTTELKTSRPWSAQTAENEWLVLTPADDANFENVATDHDFALHVQLKAEVEGLHCEPSECGQHEVVHDGRHDLTTHSVLYFCHVVVDKETQVKQEHGCHELDENPCGFTGFGPPVGRDEQIVHILWRKMMKTSNCVHLHSSSLIWSRNSFWMQSEVQQSSMCQWVLIQDRGTGRWEVVSFPWQSNNDAPIRQSHFPDENILEIYIHGALLFWTTVIFININNVSHSLFFFPVWMTVIIYTMLPFMMMMMMMMMFVTVSMCRLLGWLKCHLWWIYQSWMSWPRASFFHATYC